MDILGVKSSSWRQICQVDYQCETKTPGAEFHWIQGICPFVRQMHLLYLRCPASSFLGQSFKVTDGAGSMPAYQPVSQFE